MKNSECQPGAKVICVMDDDHFNGMIGYIGNVTLHESSTSVRYYYVNDINGSPVSLGYFCFLDSWNIIDSAPNTLKSNMVKSLSHECPCGITRSVCDYHK